MAARRLTHGRIRAQGALIALAVVGATVGLWRASAFARAESALVDARFQLRGPLPPHADIVLVGIDEESAAHFGRRVSSITRSEYARAVTNLTRAGASLVVVDVVFAREDPVAAEDAALEQALRESGRVLLVADVSETNTAYPFAGLRAEEIGEGFINLVPDDDGVVRRIPPPRITLVGDDTTMVLPIAAEAAVARAFPEGPPEVAIEAGTYAFGGLRLETSGTGILINFAGPPGTFPKIPLWRAIEGDLPPDVVRGKIVLLGSMHPLQHDQFTVPFHGSRIAATTFRERTEVSGAEMYGIEIHAHALDTILSRRPLVACDRNRQTLFFVALGVAAGLVFVILRLKPWPAAVSAMLGLAGWALAAQDLFTARGWVVDLVPGALLIGAPFVTGQMWHRALDLRRKREIEGLFGRYVSPAVAGLMIKDPTLVKLGGRKATLTIFFSDIRGFTSMSETLPPEEVAALLQEYFTEMTGIVFKHGGTLDKFIGDAIMVFFGDPVPMDDHAERAVRMALEMREAMEHLKETWRSQGRRTFDPGIGINTGDVFVGNTGSARRVSYTVLGDNVNLAARLEANAKAAQILVSRATRDAIPDIDRKFVVEPLPPITVKGKAQPVAIFQVTGVRSAPSP
ncbi:MAG: adenylate/guanylate cyclase domain-containing protein [Acidobacteria bacterium]|nr:adenylate/guanylate cyclase domain-containing protein [Acidobacteriota bacterium]